MTQEQKYLLLKDLCARLSYGIICEDAYGNALELNSIDKPNTATFKCSDNTFWTTDLDKCKPYLFPLSSMTEEQYEKFKNICGWDSDIEDVRRGKFSCIGYIGLDYFYDTIDWFNKNHFDYRGLIPMDLAIDATNLNIY